MYDSVEIYEFFVAFSPCYLALRSSIEMLGMIFFSF